jgi:hypothetical protein
MLHMLVTHGIAFLASDGRIDTGIELSRDHHDVVPS